MKNIAVTEFSSLTPPPDAKAIQPNAVDLRLDRVWRMDPLDYFLIEEGTHHHRNKVEVLPDTSGFFTFFPGVYEVQFDQIVKIGPQDAGWVITRSSLNRNGLFLTSGLYDSGYNGAMAGALHVDGGPAKIKKGTRIGQFLLFDAQSVKLYDGSYGFDQSGKAKAEEAKYHEVK